MSGYHPKADTAYISLDMAIFGLMHFLDPVAPDCTFLFPKTLQYIVMQTLGRSTIALWRIAWTNSQPLNG